LLAIDRASATIRPAMSTTLLALHGFTQNGSQFRSHLEPLAKRLPMDITLVCPDAPNVCSEGGVERLYGLTGALRLPPPHLCWWDASDDGRIYRGWETSLERLRELAKNAGPIGVLGFSQGAGVAAALAALAGAGEFPEIAFVILVAGRVPRADVLQPWFASPLRIPSLHVWGEQDAFAEALSPLLVECFEPGVREQVRWPGPHILPTRGPAADAILTFIGRHA
jgi:pimeloyl-ACP methyl ester carboxylesterase